MENPLRGNKFFRRMTLFWAMGLISYICWKTWNSPPEITGTTLSALTLIVGILATVIGFYHKNRHNDDVLVKEMEHIEKTKNKDV